MTWNERYFEMAKLVSTWSKDPTSQVGAVIVEDNYIRGVGFNGFPRCIRDTPERLNDRELKRKLMLHAEMNALTAAQGKGDTIYVYPCLPCPVCMTLIMQAGILKIVAGDKEIAGVWDLDFTRSMLNEARIELIELPV